MVAALATSPTTAEFNGGGTIEDGHSTYKIRETPMGTKRKLKVIFMGMGCSGIDFARQLGRTMEDVKLIIYGNLKSRLTFNRLDTGPNIPNR